VSTPSLQQRVRLAIERDGLIPPGSRVLAAVSGGPDSVALLRLLSLLSAECRFTLAGVAHLNHGLRGEESEADEAFCQELAAEHKLAIEIGRRDVARQARDEHVSIEVAARRARYDFFAGVAERLKIDRIATGHTRDDQAETFLLRVLRGAGATGLAGIRPRRGPVIRPLLEIRRDELLAFLASLGQPFRTDSSNRDHRIPRNWVRHRLVPLLAEHLNGDIVEVLAREATVLRDEAVFLDRLANEAAARLETALPERGVRLDAAALTELPPALARRVVRQALARTEDARFHGFDHVEQVLALARPVGESSAADLPGVRVERNGASVVLYKRGPRSRPAARGFRYELPVPGRVTIPECACRIEARTRRRPAVQSITGKALGIDQDTALIDAAAAASGLAVRSRHPGDSIRPLGLKGRKKLQDVLVDRKVPREQRDRVPLVVDADDRVLWIGGHVVSEDACVTARTRSVVVLKLIRNGEEGDEA
jgi:tRNA(Ile)-lysidine synthase